MDRDDPTRAARGIVLGVPLGLGGWCVLAAVFEGLRLLGVFA